MLSKKILILSISVLSLSACKKEITENNNKKAEPQSFKDLKVSNSFNWSLNVDVSFRVTGVSALAHEFNVLRVTSVDGKETYFEGNYSMAENISVMLNIPRVVKEVKVSFGSIEKTVPIIDTNVNFSYLSN